MRRLLLLSVALTLAACSTVGPPRPTLSQALSPAPAESPAPCGGQHVCECGPEHGLPEGVCNQSLEYQAWPDAETRVAMKAAGVPDVAVEPKADAPVSEDLPRATPFSAGLMLGAGVFLDGSGRILPAQLAVGSVKVLSVGPRSVNVLALGGISGTSVSQARPAWGAGASVELTPGTLPYEVDVATGVLWVKGEGSPAAILGFTLTPKM